jgi:DNA-binding response OmpR family regulator
VADVLGPAGYDVAAVPDLSRAARQMGTLCPDLVVLDAYQVVRESQSKRELFRAHARPDVPVVMLAHYHLGEQALALLGETCLAAATLLLPFDPRELIATVQRVIDEARRSEDPRRLDPPAVRRWHRVRLRAG